jgi:hypothetical protein
MNYCKTMLILSFGSAAFPQGLAASGPSTPTSMPCPGTLLLGLVLFLFLGLVVTVYALKKRRWSLADALSEEVTPAVNSQQNGTQTTRLVSQPALAPSSSRLIAFIGLLASFTFFVGVGLVVVWRLAKGQEPPDPKSYMPMVYGGAVTFAPYLFNKASEAISNFLPSSK